MRLLLVTIRGLEEAVKKESQFRSLSPISTDLKSRVLVEGSLDDALRLRTVSAVCCLLGVAKLRGSGLRALRLAIRETLKGASLPGETPVEVRAYVFGEGYTERIASAVAAREVKRVLKAEVKSHAPLTLQIDVFCDRGEVYVSLRETKRGLDRRAYYIRKHPQSLNPIIAAALPWLAGMRETDVLYDPMCGAGTIPIEAALTLGCRALGSDSNRTYIAAARDNARTAGVDLEFFVADAGSPPLSPSAVDLVACDPPRKPFRKALQALKLLVEQGYRKLAVVTPYLLQLTSYARSQGYSIESLVRTFQGTERIYIVLLHSR